jgi:TolB protein
LAPALGVLGVALLLVACVIAGVAIYVLLGRPDIGLPFIAGDQTPEATGGPAAATAPVGEPTTAAGATATVAPQPTSGPAATSPAAAESGAQEMISFHSNRDGNWEVYVMRPDGLDVRRLSDDPAMDAALNWTADGRLGTFTSDRDESGNVDVFVMRADGSAAVNVAGGPDRENDSDLSSDGSRIVFESNRFGDYEIWAMDADGANPVNLTNTTGGDGKPFWSPDGTKVAFESSRDGNVEVYVMNADGSGQTNLTNDPAHDGRPRWSPDGSQIAFDSDRDGNWEIYVMNADGSGPVNVTDDPAADKQPVWSPDGQRIAFNSDRGGTANIHVMQRDGSDVQEIGGAGNNWATDWSLVVLPAAAEATGLSFSDDFDPGSGWPVESSDDFALEYRDGEYHVSALKDNFTAHSIHPDLQLGDFTAAVDIRRVNDIENDAAGFHVRYNDSLNWYEVVISRQGLLGIWKYVDGKLIVVQPWTESDAIQTGQATNRLKVTCKGDQMAALVNGQHVATVRDRAFLQGQFGFAVLAFTDKPNAQVAFDNLLVTPAEDVPPPELGPLPLTEDFADAESGWLVDDSEYVKLEYRDGAYYFLQKQANTLSRSVLPEHVYSDFGIEVDAKPVAGPANGQYGLVFRYSDRNNHYLFRVSADGQIKVDRKAGGEYTELVSWQSASAVKIGQTGNHLKVTCQADRCDLYVNDEMVATITDDTLMQGQFGFMVANPEDAEGMQVAFDDLVVSAP